MTDLEARETYNERISEAGLQERATVASPV